MLSFTFLKTIKYIDTQSEIHHNNPQNNPEDMTLLSHVYLCMISGCVSVCVA